MPTDRRPAAGAVSVADPADADAHLFPVRGKHPQLPADFHERASIQILTISTRRGTATQSAGSRATRWSSIPIGFNDKFWFDFAGHPHTEKLHTIERYRRPNFGTLEYEVTIDDPGAYTRPFTLYGSHEYDAGTELMEYICNENNQDVEHIVGKDPRNKYSKPKNKSCGRFQA